MLFNKIVNKFYLAVSTFLFDTDFFDFGPPALLFATRILSNSLSDLKIKNTANIMNLKQDIEEF